MTASQYQTIRESIGTRDQVAKLLGVDRGTIRRRESGIIPITHEAAIAMKAFVGCQKGFPEDANHWRLGESKPKSTKRKK